MSKALLYVGNNLLDFDQEIEIKMQMYDLRDSDVGQSSKSYTLEIPLTPFNRTVLNIPDDVRSKIEVTDEARLVRFGIELIKGRLKILKTDRHSIRAIIEQDEWAGLIEELTTKDVAASISGSIDTTVSAVTGTWIAGAGDYKFPLVNFGQMYSEAWYNDEAPLFPYDMVPAVRVKTIVDRFFTLVGLNVHSSAFTNGTVGGYMYLLGDPVVADTQFITDKGLDVNANLDSDNQTILSYAIGETKPTVLNKVVTLNNEELDEGSDFASDVYTVPEDGTYRFIFNTKIYSKAHDNPADWSLVTSSATLSLRKNSVIFANKQVTPLTGEPEDEVDSGWIHLEAGDTIEAYVNIQVVAQNISGGVLNNEITLRGGRVGDPSVGRTAIVLTWDDRNLYPGLGYTHEDENLIPEINGLSFLKGLKRLFNLRFLPDLANRTMYIYDAVEFYNVSEIVDWTDKIDYSDPPEIETIAASLQKQHHLRYKPDESDQSYTSRMIYSGNVYDKLITLPSNYCEPGTEDRENEAFSPTIMSSMVQIAENTTELIPRIYGDKEYIDDRRRQFPPYRATSWNPRIMFWNGMVALPNGGFRLKSYPNDTGTLYNTFPQLKTLDYDDLYTDYFDDQFRRMGELKMVTCTVILQPSDIIPFTTVIGTSGWRKTYKLNVEGEENLYYITKLITDGERCKVELVQKT